MRNKKLDCYDENYWFIKGFDVCQQRLKSANIDF